MIPPFIVDFYCADAALVVEIDGSQHYTTEEEELYDRNRTAYLESYVPTLLNVVIIVLRLIAAGLVPAGFMGMRLFLPEIGTVFPD